MGGWILDYIFMKDPSKFLKVEEDYKRVKTFIA